MKLSEINIQPASPLASEPRLLSTRDSNVERGRFCHTETMSSKKKERSMTIELGVPVGFSRNSSASNWTFEQSFLVLYPFNQPSTDLPSLAPTSFPALD